MHTAARKKRWTGVKPSLTTSSLALVVLSAFWKARRAMLRPPMSAVFSVRVRWPFTNLPGSTSILLKCASVCERVSV